MRERGCACLAQARLLALAWFEDTSAQTRRQTTRDRI